MMSRVTVVIPVRNEAERLPGCLDALAAQDMASGEVEVLVIDGGSSDATVDVARKLLAGRGWARAQVLHSAAGDRSSNLNCGLAAATAPVVVRVDARSRVPAHYLRRCVDLLEGRADLAVVGGRQRAVAAGTGAVAAGVARALNNRWGMGLARYRSGGSSGETDTVYLGAYRTAELRAAGGWRTDFAVNEDFDLNRRLARFGAVWFDSDLTVDYVPRSSLTALLRQYWAFGLGKARYWRLSGDRPQPRQLVLLGAPLVGLAALGLVLGVFGALAGGSVVIAGLAAGLLIEAAGADGPRTGLRAHVTALVALGCIAGAWLSGVAVGAVRPVRRPIPVAQPAKQTA
ncbi:MAG TPA: glycosyltransferase [Acidimicrobiales bacterium]|nr:glycosyltransferase [Acidimicrobiales bacterium]